MDIKLTFSEELHKFKISFNSCGKQENKHCYFYFMAKETQTEVKWLAHSNAVNQRQCQD